MRKFYFTLEQTMKILARTYPDALLGRKILASTKLFTVPFFYQINLQFDIVLKRILRWESFANRNIKEIFDDMILNLNTREILILISKINFETIDFFNFH